MTDASWASHMAIQVPRTRLETLEAFGPAAASDQRRLTFRSDRLTDPGADLFEIVSEEDLAVAWIWSYWVD